MKQCPCAVLKIQKSLVIVSTNMLHRIFIFMQTSEMFWRIQFLFDSGGLDDYNVPHKQSE